MKNPLCLLSQRQYYSAVAYSMLMRHLLHFDDPLLLPNPAKRLQQVLLYWFLWLASGSAKYHEFVKAWKMRKNTLL